MANFKILKACSFRLDEIYRYSLNQWGEQQANKYINGLFDHFQKITENQVPSYPIPAEFKVSGFYSRYEQHFIYWRYLADGQVGIVTVLHQRMHQGLNLFGDDRL